jgi:arsenate reductase (thioredoxin)
MPTTLRRVLFLCTGNSARSILAEALLNHLGRGRFEAHSAGSHPTGRVHPLALATLDALAVPVQTPRSKSWEEFAAPDALPIDIVITVCDNAAGETCPLWTGRPVTAHWGVPDPAAVVGDEATRRTAFLDAALVLKRRVELLLALPAASFDGGGERELREIGRR